MDLSLYHCFLNKNIQSSDIFMKESSDICYANPNFVLIQLNRSYLHNIMA